VLGLEIVIVCAALLVVATLYSSVGHGGASGYLAVLSLSSFAVMEAAWLKQYAWSLNLVVAAIAFWHYYRAGHHIPKLTIPFIAASIPFAMLGGSLQVGGVIYDSLLSLTLVWAAWRLYSISDVDVKEIVAPELKTTLPVGGVIGLMSGVVGVGGGIFLSPIILLKKWATPKATAATAAFFIWVNSAASIAGAGLSGQLELDLVTLLPFAGVVLVGGFVGSRYGADIAPQQIVRKLLVGVLIIAALRRLLGIVGI
jgi:uncharacterized membrane protein YfcA